MSNSNKSPLFWLFGNSENVPNKSNNSTHMNVSVKVSKNNKNTNANTSASNKANNRTNKTAKLSNSNQNVDNTPVLDNLLNNIKDELSGVEDKNKRNNTNNTNNRNKAIVKIPKNGSNLNANDLTIAYLNATSAANKSTSKNFEKDLNRNNQSLNKLDAMLTQLNKEENKNSSKLRLNINKQNKGKNRTNANELTIAYLNAASAENKLKSKKFEKELNRNNKSLNKLDAILTRLNKEENRNSSKLRLNVNKPNKGNNMNKANVDVGKQYLDLLYNVRRMESNKYKLEKELVKIKNKCAYTDTEIKQAKSHMQQVVLKLYDYIVKLNEILNSGGNAQYQDISKIIGEFKSNKQLETDLNALLSNSNGSNSVNMVRNNKNTRVNLDSKTSHILDINT